ncbi:glycosyltransferase family 2 protein [Rhodobacteraceae bacterium CH30]|nr:glycosyltransferase family 2 protein [Rhodobacteraceae bacterium CH30]
MNYVDIAMATYNGEKFIKFQIESIQTQTYKNWNLIISDDGSTDNTVHIIKQYAKSDHRIKLANTLRQGGVVNNFNTALSNTTAKYVLFCDQDDVWPSNRLQLLVDEIHKIEKSPNIPCLIFTDLEVVDEKLNTLAKSFYSSQKINPLNNTIPENLLWNCTVYGCTTIFNRALIEISTPIPEQVTMHDNWLALNAATMGTIHYLPEKTILYRQHSHNVVGGKRKNLAIKILHAKKTISNICESTRKYKFMQNQIKKTVHSSLHFHNFSIEEKTILKGMFIETKSRPWFSIASIIARAFYKK